MAMVSVPGTSSSNYSRSSYTTTTMLQCTICKLEFLTSESDKAEAHGRLAHPEAYRPTCSLCNAVLRDESNEVLFAHFIDFHPGFIAKLKAQKQAEEASQQEISFAKEDDERQGRSTIGTFLHKFKFW